VKEEFVYLCTFANISKAGIFITIFPGCFQSHVGECLIVEVCNFKVNMNNNCVKCLQGLSFFCK
jgi:hypothetical protein